MKSVWPIGGTQYMLVPCCSWFHFSSLINKYIYSLHDSHVPSIRLGLSSDQERQIQTLLECKVWLCTMLKLFLPDMVLTV